MGIKAGLQSVIKHNHVFLEVRSLTQIFLKLSSNFDGLVMVINGTVVTRDCQNFIFRSSSFLFVYVTDVQSLLHWCILTPAMAHFDTCIGSDAILVALQYIWLHLLAFYHLETICISRD